MEKEWNEDQDVFVTSILEIYNATKSYIQGYSLQGRYDNSVWYKWHKINLKMIAFITVIYDYFEFIFKVEINLSNIISLDTERRIVRVEPMVSIGILNDYLIKLGWTVPVVPELDDLTIGGLVMGGGIETTSHK